ncbi:hypothetical protein C8Q79DRAFT_968341 [Trametes meyenii]|nr:hypothetical protein C8Q79DRAFT_968341 [Trametes meyenii]
MPSRSWSVLSSLQVLARLAFLALFAIFLVGSLGYRFLWALDLLSYNPLRVSLRHRLSSSLSLSAPISHHDLQYKTHNVFGLRNHTSKPIISSFFAVDILTDFDSRNGCATLLTSYGDDPSLCDSGPLGAGVRALRPPLHGEVNGRGCLRFVSIPLVFYPTYTQ